MGHGNKSLIDEYRNQAKTAQSSFIEWQESICNAVADYCEKLYKDTGEIVKWNEPFFSSLADIDKVVCLGISFGDVDVPYLTKIEQSIQPSAKWIVYYFGPDAERHLKEVFDITEISKKHQVTFCQSQRFWDQ